jgi:hypothetical protein
MAVIFVHIPKTAGTSLRSALLQRVGEQSVHFDYGAQHEARTSWRSTFHALLSKAIILSENQLLWTKIFAYIWSMKHHSVPRNIVYGHFVVAKYLRRNRFAWDKMPEYKYVTFVREPLERAISQYYYFLESPAPFDPVLEMFHRHKLSLAEFLLHPFFANTQSRYTYGLPVEQFDFVGVVDYMEDSIAMLGIVVPELSGIVLPHENKTQTKNQQEIRSTLTPEFIARFQRLHTLDYKLYRSALRMLSKKHSEATCKF